MKTFHSFPSLSFKEHRLVYEEAPNDHEIPVVSAESSNESVDPERAVDDAIQSAQTDILYLQKNMAAVDNVKNPDAKAQYQGELNRVLAELNSLTNQKQVLTSTTKTTTPKSSPAPTPSNTAPSTLDNASNSTQSKERKSEREGDEEKKLSDREKSEEKKDDKNGESKNAEKSDDKKEDATESIKEDLEEKGVDAENAERIAKETEDVLKDGKDGNKESNEKIENREQLAKAVAQNPHALEVFQELSQRLALGTGLSQRELLVGDSIVTHIALYDKNMAKEKVDELRPKNPQETTEFIEMVVQNAPASSKEKNREQKDASNENVDDEKKRESRLYREVRGDGTKGKMKTVSDLIAEKQDVIRINTERGSTSEYETERDSDQKETEKMTQDIKTLQNLESKTKKLAKDSQEKIAKLGYDIYKDNENISNQLTTIGVDHDGSLGFKLNIDKESKAMLDGAAASMNPNMSKTLDSAVKEGNPAVILKIAKIISENAKVNKAEQKKS